MGCSHLREAEISIKASLILGMEPEMATPLITVFTGRLLLVVPSSIRTAGNLMIGEWLKLDSERIGT